MNTWTHADLAQRCGKATRLSDGSYKAMCPAHDDKKPSLHISQAADGSTLVRCQAGCAQPTVWRACVDLMGGTGLAAPPPPPKKTATKNPSIVPVPEDVTAPDEIKHSKFGTPVRLHKYFDALGRLCFLNCRFEFDPPHQTEGRKTHRPFSYTAKGWRFQAPEAGERTPYRLHLLKPAGTVMVHEGEKAADAGPMLAPDLSHLGWYGGAGNAHCTDWSALAGRDVWLLPDADAPGIAGMEKFATILRGLGCTVRVCRNVQAALEVMAVPTDLRKGFDAADAVDLGWTHDQFIAYLNAAVSDDAPATDLATDAATDDAVAIFTASLNKTPIPSESPFIPLGYANDNYFYLSRATKQIHRLTPSAHKRPSLISLHPTEGYWIMYGGHARKGADWDNCAARMMDECHKAGLFDPDAVRGRGAWWDNGKVVLHLGDRLIIDGVEHDVLARPGAFIYELAPRLEGPGDTPMDDKEAAGLLDICHQFSWESPVSALYLMGWVVLAPICGAIQWRPHLWITGAKGTGKSTIEDKFVKPLLGNIAVSVQGDSTEAGIRQTLKHDALPVIIDEIESEGDRSSTRTETIVQMMRQASSDTAAMTIKGGATGQATTYRVRSMFLLASIGEAIRRAADQSRIAKLSLRKSERDWEPLKEKLAEINHDTSRRLIARTVSMIPIIRANGDTFTRIIAGIADDQRLADQYGILLAGAAAMKYTRVLAAAECESIVDSIKADITRHADAMESDEMQCLHYLLQQTVRVDKSSGAPGQMSVGELVEAAVRGGGKECTSNEAIRALARHGIKADSASGRLCVARTHSQMAKLFAGTPYQAGWAQYLERIPDAGPTRSVTGKEVCVRFAGGSPVRAVAVPLGLALGEEASVHDIGCEAEAMPF